MRTLVIGIDSGTQSTKALILDVTKKQVVGSASVAYGLLPNLPPGAKEQHPHTWRDATAKAIRAALKQAKAVASGNAPGLKRTGCSGNAKSAPPGVFLSGKALKTLAKGAATKCGQMTTRGQFSGDHSRLGGAARRGHIWANGGSGLTVSGMPLLEA